jgi:hypothetical protein
MAMRRGVRFALVFVVAGLLATIYAAAFFVY